MPKTNREVSALSKEIGAWVKARRESEKPDELSRPALAARVQDYLGAPVYKVMIQRIEEGTREVSAAEARALALAFGLPPEALMNPATIGATELRALGDRARKARGSYWTACADIYEVGREYGDLFAQAFTPEQSRAIEDAFAQVFDVAPARSRVSPAIADLVQSSARLAAIAGKQHEADVRELERVAAKQGALARELRQLLARDRAEGVTPDELEVYLDVIEYTEAKASEAKQDKASQESYYRPEARS